VVQLYGWSAWPGSMALIMEYMPGGNLLCLISRPSAPLDPVLRLRICGEVAGGLAVLHNLTDKNRLFHSDIKPENILLTADLHCKIADFGGACLIKYTRSHTSGDGSSRNAQLTKVYAAPERLSIRAKPSKEQDTYSYGIIVHGVLSRQMPYANFTSENEYVNAVMQGERPDMHDITELKNGLPETSNDRNIFDLLESVMMSCWVQEPRRRPSMLTVRDDLMNLLSKQDLACIQRSVADTLQNMHVFIPSPKDRRVLPLSCFNVRERRFDQGMKSFLSLLV